MFRGSLITHQLSQAAVGWPVLCARPHITAHCFAAAGSCWLSLYHSVIHILPNSMFIVSSSYLLLLQTDALFRIQCTLWFLPYPKVQELGLEDTVPNSH